MLRQRASVRACSPPALYPRGRGSGSRSFSRGAGMPGRTSPKCWRTAPRDCLRRFKWPMLCRGTLPSCRRNCRSSWETAMRIQEGALWTWCPIFPSYVLESLAEVYAYDAQAEERDLSPEERLRFHQEHSGPVMEKLHAWLSAQFAEKKVEPNSGLGSAIQYSLKHWERLTLFLRQARAPLDNNIVERALKKSILHRKNSLFYKTENGAEVGDLFMSLIHTCELNGANAFDYLTELQRHGEELVKNPEAWTPWNYRNTLERGLHS